MARPSLGKKQAAGDSPRFAIKHTIAERESIEAVLEPGETMAEFTREAWRLLIDKRRRKAKRDQ
jgi:hypothetical protein